MFTDFPPNPLAAGVAYAILESNFYAPGHEFS
jgi:hypothetical protein